uniref:Uncharacterized protein n=1 Tax=Oryza meridionalis TaxID=40149 RepID=A0A0E0CLS3_9ORYZ
MELQLCRPFGPQYRRSCRLHRRLRIDNLVIRTGSSSAAKDLLPLLRASPPHLQVATIAALGRWSSFLYMATDVTV